MKGLLISVLIGFTLEQFLLCNATYSVPAVENNRLTIKLKYDRNSQFYYGEIDLGKDALQKSFKALFDTGSSTSWFFSEKCMKCKPERKLLRECEGDSCGNYENGLLENIHYGTGSVMGFRTIDYLNLPNPRTGKIKQIPHNMLLITEAHSFLQKQSFDGIIGLSFTEEDTGINSDNSSILSFLRSLFLARIITEESFSIALQREKGGVIEFGGFNSELIDPSSSLHTFQIDENQSFWKVSLVDLRIDSKHSLLNPLQTAQNKNQILSNQNEGLQDYLAHFDSGSNLIMVEQSIAEAYTSLLRDEYGISCAIFETNSQLSSIRCQCKDGIIEKFPGLSFTMKSTTGKMVEYLIPANKIFSPDPQIPGVCASLIFIQNDESNAIQNEILVGLPFFENHLLNFNPQNRTIGIAESRILPEQQDSFLSFDLSVLGLIIFLFGLIVASKIIRFRS